MGTTLQADLDWLRGLDKEIGHYVPRTSPRHGGFYQQNRRVTEQELTKVFEIVLRNNLPVTMHNANMGFGVGIAVYEPPIEAPYPGIEPEDLRPPRVFWIDKDHLPLSEAQGKLKDRTTFEDGWRVFSQLSHADANHDLCKACGLDEPKSKGTYDY